MSKSFTARPTIEVDPRNPPKLYAPQAVVVKGVRADGLFYKVDIGRICYLERAEDSGRSSGGKHHSFGLVSTDSLSDKIEKQKELKNKARDEYNQLKQEYDLLMTEYLNVVRRNFELETGLVENNKVRLVRIPNKI